MRLLLPRIPFVCITATATKDTRDKIFEVLLIVKEPHIVEKNPSKPNIAHGKKCSPFRLFLISIPWLLEQ